jgi:hypothetical protein
LPANVGFALTFADPSPAADAPDSAPPDQFVTNSASDS